MKTSVVITFILACLTASSFAQKAKLDTSLIQRIDSMFKDDQRWRKEYNKFQQKKSAFDEETINSNWLRADSINEVKAKAIINKYGYPGYNRVGDTSNDFWAIVQHCDDDIAFQERILVLLKKEVDKNNADRSNYALLTDRVLVNKHQKQIYGTQIKLDPKTKKAAPFPLKFPKSVDKLRKQMGLGPLAVYVKSFNTV
ncbi:DUF6624 domain-containing protein [Mucilaginibacter dorajii]|nr:DUF6624 domain-containing protein [Mucilaginibacter dorajii]MCS3733696.1 hypothetical protein [Mucilaginibacter dorajii]